MTNNSKKDTTPTEDQIMEALIDSGLHVTAPGLLVTKWERGVDVKQPSKPLLHFLRRLRELSLEEPVTGGTDV